MREAKSDKFPRLLICEGYKDAAFFCQFIHEKKLPRFHIRFSEGKDKIETTLRAYIVEPKSNWPGIGHVVVVGDCDDDPKARFAAIAKQVNAVPPLKAASKPFERSSSRPTCSIIMLPDDRTEGALESIFQAAAKSVNAGHADAVSNLLSAVHADRWKARGKTDKVRIDKAWLRAWLAIQCADPFVPLGSVFDEKKNRSAIPLDHTSLKPLADFLATFEKKTAGSSGAPAA